MTIIDAHLHVWDLEISDYSWLGPEHGPLHRSFLPAQAREALTGSGVELAVLVQAEDSLVDTRYLLAVAEQEEWVHGVVGWVRLDSPPEAARQLEELATPALRGIRHLVHEDPRSDFLELPSVRESLGMLAERGLVFDVPDAWPRHLDAVAKLAADLPELTVVVDHLGKPPRGTDELEAWSSSLRSAAEQPGVVAKLSGLQMPGQPLTAADLRPVLHVALEAFGADRLMYGGDWPMTVPFGGYDAVFSIVHELVSELTTQEQEAVWSGTAQRTYGGSLHG
ncbi:MAG: L-fuconolactonase [Nocardioidaceae bacterium]|nr:L-fuconolactonase [Nocardioidaceae bacterium]